VRGLRGPDGTAGANRRARRRTSTPPQEASAPEAAPAEPVLAEPEPPEPAPPELAPLEAATAESTPADAATADQVPDEPLTARPDSAGPDSAGSESADAAPAAEALLASALPPEADASDADGPVNYDEEGLGEVEIDGLLYRFDSGRQGTALCLSRRREGVWRWSYVGELRWDGRDLRSKALDRALLTRLSASLRTLAEQVS